MFALNLLGVDFPDGMRSGGEMAVVDPSGIGVEMHETKRREQLLQFNKHLICPTSEHVGQDHPSQMINRMPQPALVCFTLYETPHLIDLRVLDSADLYRDRLGTAPF